MMKGSSQDWKFTHISRYTSTTATSHSQAQAEEGRLHGFVLAAQVERGAARQMGFFLVA